MKVKRVALALPSGSPHHERMVRGVLDYVTRHGHWRLATSSDSPVFSLSSLQGWQGDGIIGFINTSVDARIIAKLGILAVNVSGAMEHSTVPRVTVDDLAIGRQAAEHLLGCGFRRFAYYGLHGFRYARLREKGFCDTVAAAGGACEVFLASPTIGQHATWCQMDEALAAWLKSLMLPIGLFTCHDYRPRLILEACHELGLTVPGDVAVLGVNNDEIACEFCEPSLSSVSRNAERVGYEAAGLLDRLMAGRPAPEHDVLIPPDGVMQRRSTDIFAADDPEVAVAVRYMQEHLAEPITVEDMAQRLAISRRTMEHVFQRVLGRTPHVYLSFLRIRRARQLLVEDPKLSLRDVARACGFSDSNRLRLAFARFVGVGPREYRQVHGRKAKRT